ncbi:MAG TPA: LruC domain-containing protein, partial [Xylanibacter oryzae]|nr:LruC domain-containing protein [Xylanibacter oryzae]
TFYISGSVNNVYNLGSGDFMGKRIIVKSGGVWNISGSEGGIRNGVTVIVAKGGKINLNGKTLNSVTTSGDAFIIMPGGEISGTGSSALTETNGGSCYNGGVVSISSFNWTSSGGVYNSGNMTIAGDATFNTSTNFINYGTAQLNGSINIPASGYIYNAGGAFLLGSVLKLATSATLINRGNCHFVNTDNSVGNANYKTSCKLIIDNNFIPSNVVISNGGSIQCKNMILHSSNINIGNASILKAENTTFESFIVTGPTSGDYAVCVLGNISNSGSGPNCNFIGNIYVDITSNPWATEVNKYQFWQQKTDKYTNGAKEVGAGEADITIPSGDCSIGYTPTNKGGDDIDKAAVCTYGFEDMTTETGDYDFNDVVLKVSKKDDTHYTVKLSAAGAIKKLAVKFNNGTTDVVVFDEIHSAFGVGSTDLVNTGNGTKDVAAVSKDVEVPSGFSLSKNGDFYIVDLSNNRTVHIPTFTSGFNKGDVPYALRVPTDWSYPTERTTVTNAYLNFATWAKDAKKSTDWYLIHVFGKVMEGK